MERTTKIKIGAVVVYSVALVAIGRYTVPEKIKIETKTVAVEKVVYKEKEDTTDKKHQHTVIVEDKKPNGEVVTKTDTTYDDTRDDKKDIVDNKDTSITQDQVKEITRGSSPVTISALGGLSLNGLSPVYGVSVSKPLLGPIVVGVWGLNNTNPAVGLSCGVSVGLQF